MTNDSFMLSTVYPELDLVFAFFFLFLGSRAIVRLICQLWQGKRTDRSN